MMADDLYAKLNSLRDEYRRDMNNSTSKAQEYAQLEDMETVSEWSSRAARKQEAFSALNRAIKLVEDNAALPSHDGAGK